MAFLSHGCSVAAICPTGNPLHLVPGIGPLYRYRATSSLQSLRQAILSSQPDLLVPCDDGVVQQIHQLHALHPELRTLIERSLGNPSAFSILESRKQFLDLAATLGILVPLTHQIRSAADLANWPHASAVLKTEGSTGGNGVAIAHDIPTALNAFRNFSKPLTVAKALKRTFVNRDPLALWLWRASFRPGIVAQQFISGRPANTMIVCWQGEVLASVTVEVICSQGTTGAATVVRFLQNPEIEEASGKIAAHLGLSGFYGLDFVLEPQPNNAPPRAWLIEINPRTTQLGHLVLPNQGDLAGVLAARFRHPALRPVIHAKPIESDTVAFYPQALIWNPKSAYVTHCYHDVPKNAPALAAELLLKEWPYRQWPARLYHYFFPPQRPSEAKFDPTSPCLPDDCHSNSRPITNP